MSDLLTQSARSLLALLVTKQISVAELADLHIARIERLNPLLNAVVDFDPDRVRAQARVMDAAPLEGRGPLHGLPLTIKSSISVAGYLCETGSIHNRGYRPAEDAEGVKNLRSAGALLLGTTNCPEYLMAYETDNELYGRTNNPWALDRSAGGSSGGESAAIAAGMSAGGLGSDGGGSVRTPAHFTGICALKPTPGRLSSVGHLPPCAGPFALLGVIGPMARAIGDVTMLFRAAAAASLDPAAAPVPYRSVSEAEAKQQAVGYFEDDGITPVTADTRQAVRSAVEALRRRGFRVEPFAPAALEAARKLWWTFFVQCGAILLDPASTNAEPSGKVFSPTFRQFLDLAGAEPPLTASALLNAWADVHKVQGELLETMRAIPILLCPVCAIPAFRHGERQWAIDGGPVAYFDSMRYTQWFNLLGAPAAVVPITQSAEGLPIGVQIAGRPYADEHVLAVAEVLDQEFGYVAPPGIAWRTGPPLA